MVMALKFRVFLFFFFSFSAVAKVYLKDVAWCKIAPYKFFPGN